MTQHAAAAYVAFLESLTPERLPELVGYLAPEVRFKDPFNDASGRASVIRVFAKIFEDVTDVRFAARDLACGGEACFFAWTLHCRLQRSRRPMQFEGVTELRFDGEGRVTAHIDHWDAASQLYARMPVLGWLLERLRRRLGAAET
ncbi:MAG: nuclear transport factor 2 family protein [Kiloniellales bacterium]|nr:nuclear transport factor 2 family protein [Kiloniellales bacterium]